VAVPAAVLELCPEHGLGERPDPWIAVQEVSSKPGPEPEVAEIDAPEQERAVHLLAARHEAPEQPSSGALAAGWSSGRPHATSSNSVQVDAVHRPFGHSPSEP
jgi:hypothetical protein